MRRSLEQARRDIVVARNILDIMQSTRKPMSYKDLSLRIKELDRGNWMHWRVLRYPLGRVLDRHQQRIRAPTATCNGH